MSDSHYRMVPGSANAIQQNLLVRSRADEDRNSAPRQTLRVWRADCDFALLQQLFRRKVTGMSIAGFTVTARFSVPPETLWLG